MEARAPYHTAAPSGPRNLAAALAAWLRGLGFTATEATHGPLTVVEANWQSPEGLRFYLEYQWSALRATAALVVYQPGERYPLDLVKEQHVGRLREVRQLLHNDVCFRTAWQAAKGQPAAITQ